MADKETEEFLRTGRMSPRQRARIRLQSETGRAGKEPTAGEVRGLFGKGPKKGQKKPRRPKRPEGKPPHRTLPLPTGPQRPKRKPPKLPKRLEASFQKYNIARDLRKRA